MASSNALIYHPAVTHFNAYVATTIGRDKALRTIQYFSRFLSYYTYRQNYPQSTVDLFAKLKANLGMVRKAMRIGKFVEHLRAAAATADAKGMDPILRACAVGRQLGYAAYLFADMLTYLDAAGVRKSDGAKRLQRQAYQAWAVGLGFSIAGGIYGVYQIRQQRAHVIGPGGLDGEKAVQGKALLRALRALHVQLLSDLCDLTVPSSALGWVDLDDGIVGLAGTVSSLIGLQAQWAKTAPVPVVL